MRVVENLNCLPDLPRKSRGILTARNVRAEAILRRVGTSLRGKFAVGSLVRMQDSHEEESLWSTAKKMISLAKSVRNQRISKKFTQVCGKLRQFELAELVAIPVVFCILNRMIEIRSDFVS